MSEPEFQPFSLKPVPTGEPGVYHGWLAWLPWWLPVWVPVVTLGGVLVIAAGIFLVVTRLVHL